MFSDREDLIEFIETYGIGLSNRIRFYYPNSGNVHHNVMDMADVLSDINSTFLMVEFNQHRFYVPLNLILRRSILSGGIVSSYAASAIPDGSAVSTSGLRFVSGVDHFAFLERFSTGSSYYIVEMWSDPKDREHNSTKNEKMKIVKNLMDWHRKVAAENGI